MPFQYKYVLLVGATSGIGLAMANKLVEEGAHVIAVGRRQDRLDAFVKQHGPDRSSAVKFDITDTAGLDAFVERINTTFPNLDCVFLNAGTQHPVALSKPAEVNLEAFHAEVNTNFTCIVDMTLKFLPHLQAKSYPTGLVVTGTHLALIPAAAIPAYSASKAALHSFLYCLRAQTEKAGSKTKIIEIWPPLVQSELHDYMGAERGRGMGMPVDVFTDKAYAQLAGGADLVSVGSVGSASEEEYLDLVEKRKKIADSLTDTMLAHFPL